MTPSILVLAHSGLFTRQERIASYRSLIDTLTQWEAEDWKAWALNKRGRKKAEYVSPFAQDIAHYRHMIETLVREAA